MIFTGVFEKHEDWWVAWAEEIPGACTQGASLDEARENLIDAIQMILEANRELAERELLGRDVIRERLSISSGFETMLASEDVLRKDWDSPDEDAAWADL